MITYLNGIYTLSVFDTEKINHVAIHKSKGQFFLKDERKFDTIKEFAKYCM